LGQVPLDPNVRKNGDQGTPTVSASPDSPAAQALKEIANRVAARISVLAAGT
jgi:ATP-binding protein involved in chromosome partitioning